MNSANFEPGEDLPDERLAVIAEYEAHRGDPEAQLGVLEDAREWLMQSFEAHPINIPDWKAGWRQSDREFLEELIP